MNRAASNHQQHLRISELRAFAHYSFFCFPSFTFRPRCYGVCFFKCTSPFWSSELTLFCPSVNIFQIYFYCYLHVRVSDKDICKRILRSAVHLLERSLELAGLHGHRHGVSNNHSACCTLHITCGRNHQRNNNLFCLSIRKPH